jgi:hypothetical protein
MPYKAATFSIRYNRLHTQETRLISVDAFSFDVAQRLARYELPAEGEWRIENVMYLPNTRGKFPKLLTLEQALDFDSQ